MELWIRSQDKDRLFRAENLYIDEFYQVVGYKTKEQKTISGMAIWHNEKIIAKYDTRERCLEILDEIQNLLFAPRQIVFNERNVDKDEYDELCRQLKTNGVACVPSDSEIKYLDKDWVLYEMPEK